ncbi:hypothetical protein BH11CYA1_BH11CYA1_10440 [soil metagenome]
MKILKRLDCTQELLDAREIHFLSDDLQHTLLLNPEKQKSARFGALSDTAKGVVRGWIRTQHFCVADAVKHGFVSEL